MTSGPEALEHLNDLIRSWVHLPEGPNPDEELSNRIDILERVLEIARLSSGKVVNRTRMSTVISSRLAVDTSRRTVTLGANGPLLLDNARWPAPNERVPSELQTPLLIYLLGQYRRPEEIHKTIEGFVLSIREYLGPYDVESTVTGVPRIMTNTRLAANTLREWGLLQNSQRVRHKSWELTHLGLLAGAVLVDHPIAVPHVQRDIKAVHARYLAVPVMAALRWLTQIDQLLRALTAITWENLDTLESLAVLSELVGEYASLAEAARLRGLTASRNAAFALLAEIESLIPVDELADDLAVDQAIRRVLGP